MALTFGTQKRFSLGARFQTVTPITVDTSYPDTGWSLTPAQLGCPLGLVDSVRFEYAGVDDVGGLNLQYDPVNQKLLAFSLAAAATGPQAEVTPTNDISSALTNLQAVAIGR